jgi:hypothetical protein
MSQVSAARSTLGRETARVAAAVAVIAALATHPLLW